MQKLTLISVLAMLCLIHNKSASQNLEIAPFQIGERVPDLPLRSLINYKDSIASLSSFGNKIIILDFWNIHCSTCIKMFPLEDSLQNDFQSDIQIVLVTKDSIKKVEEFLKKYNEKYPKPLSLPILANDIIFNKLFYFSYIPHYVWILPSGQILAQSSHSMISSDVLNSVIAWSKTNEKRMRSYNLPEIKFVYQKMTPEFEKIIQKLNN